MDLAANESVLADAGLRVARQFHLLNTTWLQSRSANDPDYNDFQNEKDRFDLWASSLGLYQQGHASLDYRFRDAASLRTHTQKLLQDLTLALEELENTFSALVRNPANNDAAQSGDDTGSYSSDDDLLDEYEGETTAQASMKSIADCNDHLFKLAIEVRNPSTRLSMSKAFQYRCLDEATGLDLFDRFVSLQVDEKHVEIIIFHARRGPTAPEYDFRYLVNRMAKANTLRRRQFGYWRHHRTKLAQSGPDMGFSDRRAPSQHSKPTTATHLDLSKVQPLNHLDGYHDGQSVASVVTLHRSESTNEERIEYPDPPSLVHSEEAKRTIPKEFLCPFCFTICPVRLAQKQSWNSHIRKDLRPYQCTRPHCETETQLYDSFTDWASHENAHIEAYSHAPAQKDAYVADSDTGSSMPSHAGLDKLTCSFCRNRFEESSSYFQHVARHLVRIALFALPRSNPFDFEDGSTESALRSVAANKSTQTDHISSQDASSFASLTFSSEPNVSHDLSDRDNIHAQTSQQPLEQSTVPDQAHSRNKSQSLLLNSELQAQQTGALSAALGTGVSNVINKWIRPARSNAKTETRDRQKLELLERAVEDDTSADWGRNDREQADYRKRVVEEEKEAKARMQAEYRKRAFTEEQERRAREQDEYDKRAFAEEEARRAREQDEYRRMIFEKEEAKVRTEEEYLKRALAGQEERARKKKEQDQQVEEQMRQKFRALGYSNARIEELMKGKRETRPGDREWAIDMTRPTYIKVNRKYLSPDTLDHYQLPWEWDKTNSEYIVIKRYIDDDFQEVLFEHTKSIRMERKTNKRLEKPLMSSRIAVMESSS